jgi:hypothetical protein
MPVRETQKSQKQSLVLNGLGGVNERVQATELKPSEWSRIGGAWPEFQGLQARLWGKGVWAKYDKPVMGMFQFWTPLGYAGGTLQLGDNLGFGDWIIPGSVFPDLTIIPTLDTDLGGYTIGDFGNSVITMIIPQYNLNQEGTGLPDYTDGSPYGGGKKCRIQTSLPDTYPLNGLIASQSVASNVVAQYTLWSGGVTTHVGPPPPVQGCPRFPYEGVGVPLPAPAIGGYANDPIINNLPGAGKFLTSSAAFLPDATCELFGIASQGWNLFNRRSILDLTALQPVYVGFTTICTLSVTASVDENFSYFSYEQPLNVNFAALDAGGNFDSVLVDPLSFLPEGTVSGLVAGGFHVGASVTVNSLNVYVQTRICQ